MRKKKFIYLTPDKSLCLIDDFLTPRECAILIKMGMKKGLQTYDKFYVPKASEKNKKPSKRDTFTVFPVGHNKTIRAIEKRISYLTKIPSNYAERSKVMNYQKGAAHTAHYDTLFKKSQGDISDRILTFMVYLNNVEEGGETIYPDLGIKIIPKKGRAVVMYNYEGGRLPEKGEKFTVPSKFKINVESAYHGGGKIQEGEKWIFVKFIHSKPFTVKGDRLITEKKVTI